MKRPTKPKAPAEPNPPKEYYVTDLKLRPGNYANLAQMLADIPEGIDYKDIRVESEYFDSNEDYFVISDQKATNATYKTQLKYHERALIQYQKNLKSYSAKLAQYERDLAKWSEWKKSEEIKAAKTLLKKYGERL